MNGQQSLRKRAGKRRNKGGEGRERVTKHDRCDICRKSYLTMLLMQCKQSHELPALSILSYFTLLTVARHMAHSSYSWRAREALEALIRAFTLSGSSDKACTQVSLALAYSFMLRQHAVKLFRQAIRESKSSPFVFISALPMKEDEDEDEERHGQFSLEVRCNSHRTMQNIPIHTPTCMNSGQLIFDRLGAIESWLSSHHACSQTDVRSIPGSVIVSFRLSVFYCIFIRSFLCF